MLVATRTVASGYLPSRGSIESSPFFRVHEVFQLMVEAHQVADPELGEGFFPINETLIQTQPIWQDPPSTYCIVAYFIFTIYSTLSTVVKRRRARISWYRTSFVVWKVSRGVHNKIVSGRGRMTLLPPFSCWANSPSEKDGSPRRHSAFFGGGFPPQKKVSENEDSSSIACPQNLFCWPPASQIESTIATTTLVHRK